ncbi:uncharacterized protein [Haliotis cracherodii]|uniref:uncharacterized protein n=1 Tax=Haliotis cracherodii TaxID=6455 RepID=UPI0039E81079
MKFHFYITLCNFVFINTQMTSNDSSVDVFGSYLNDLLTSVKDVSLNGVLNTTTGMSILHCNVFCNGTTVTKVVDLGCSSANPICKTCRCDADCNEYGDCCPDERLNVTMERENRHVCVSGTNKKYVFTGPHTGYYIITTCPEESNLEMPSASQISADDLTPVTSITTNITYLNEVIAECHDDNIIIRWEKENVCHRKRNSSHSNRNDSSTDCIAFIHPPSNILPRPCDTDFADQQYVDSCNKTGLWDGSFSDITEEQCRLGIYYPVVGGTYMFKNIFCYMCNGLLPSVFKCLRAVQRVQSTGYSISTLVCTNCDRRKCKENEWHDRIKNECRAMYCRSGYRLKGETCQLTAVGLSRVEYTIAVLFRPTENNTSDPRLQDWNFIEQLVVHNIPLVAEEYNMTYYMFSVYKLVYIGTANSSRLVNEPSFGLTLMFRTNQTCCRDTFEETMVALLGDIWSMGFKGSKFQFTLSEDDFYTYGVSKRQLYKMHPPYTNPQKIETYDSLPSEYVETPEDYVYLPTVLPKCSYVYLSVNEFSWNTDASISLQYVDITIQFDKFIEIDEQNLIICVDTMKELYSNYQDPVKLAEHILTLVFSILSLICLALTFITYCTFPSLLTLPTKNTMCLVGFLFLAQLLLLFKDVAIRDETACKIIGVLIHYLWLTVILWMNVCSYHMFHVFVVDAGKPMGTQSRLLKYSLYANGLSLIIVLITIFSNLGVSSGSHIGYGVTTCYLNTSLLVGVAFVAPLGVVLLLNIIFFSVSVWTMAKINKMSASIGAEKSQVHIYIKLSTLTGIFWILAILGDVLQQQVLIFISIVLNASQGIFIFISYVANKRVLQLWRGKMNKYIPTASSQSPNQTMNTQL